MKKGPEKVESPVRDERLLCWPSFGRRVIRSPRFPARLQPFGPTLEDVAKRLDPNYEQMFLPMRLHVMQLLNDTNDILLDMPQEIT